MNSTLVLKRSTASCNKNELLFTLTDKNGEQTLIKQTFEKVSGKSVKIKMEAPIEVLILRAELVK